MMKILVKILHYINRKYLLCELQNAGKIHHTLKIGSIHNFELSNNLHLFVIDKYVKFYNNVNITVGRNASLEIGENTTINKNASIVSLDKIVIGKNCLIGENVKIYDNNHKVDMIDGLQFPNHKEFNTSSVIIGNNCWLGSNVTILKGVTVGDNSIIGAGCVIYKSVSSNTTVINKQDLVFKNTP